MGMVLSSALNAIYSAYINKNNQYDDGKECRYVPVNQET